MRRLQLGRLLTSQVCDYASRQCGRIHRRYIQISSVPSSKDSALNLDITQDRPAEAPDAQFEILGRSSSLLSASISASQALYTRKGTLVGFNGNAEHTTSKLSLLEPVRRAAGGIPFLYQKITSTSPFTVLVASKSAFTSYSVVHLDGRLDWMIAQRNALLAWTGHTLSLRPHINLSLDLSHWGRTSVTGRGLLCLSGKGHIYQINLKIGEEYVVHPGNVIAYAMMRHAPEPYRFKTTALRLQRPNLTSRLPDTRFFRTVRESQVWTIVARTSFAIRTWFRRSVLGDRLFLRFQGPAQILVQSRGSAIVDSLSDREVNEIADTPAGAGLRLVAKNQGELQPDTKTNPSVAAIAPTELSYASVQNGSVKFDTK